MSDPTDIRNFLRLSDRVTTSGRLQDGDPVRLAEAGVRRVINLAMPDHPEALPDAEAAMADMGLAYTHIPVPFDAPSEAHYRAFVAALEADETPVHVHCIMNWRVSAFFYRYHLERGMDEAQARGQMERIWSPEENDHPDAPKWAAFVRGEAILSDFTGHHVVVTGASSGIGLVTAQLLARRGAKVSLLARRQELLDDAVAGIGANAAGFAADVGQKDQLDAALEAAAAKFGPATGLFANAGLTGGFTPALAFDPAAFEETIRVNLISVFWAIQKVLPAMVEAKKGAILVTGSMASKRGLGLNPAYVSSKHGLLGLSRAIAVEMAPHGVRCNCIIPGFIRTEALDRIPPEQQGKIEARVPQRRMGTPEELAEVAAFLLSDAASHVTAQDWAVDGGTLETLEV